MRLIVSSRLARSLSLCCAIACGVSAAVAAGGPPLPQVTVAHPLAKTVPRWDEYTGRFEPLQQVEVRPRVSGAVDTINFVDGQIVKTGDLLFVIDPRPYQIAVDSAKADVAKAQAQVEVAANDVPAVAAAASKAGRSRRATSISARPLSTSPRRSSSAPKRPCATPSSTSNGRRCARRYRAASRTTRSTSAIWCRAARTGATLLTTIVTLDPIHFVFDASEADYIRYARLAAAKERPSSREVKNPVMVRLADETDWSHSHAGVMDFVDNQLNSRGGTIRGRAIFDNKDLFLLPGTFGRLRLFGGNINALLIPDATIVSDQASKIVLTVGPTTRSFRRTVTLGAMYEGLRVILAGLSESDRVVIEGIANPFVRPGAVVDPKDGAITLSANRLELTAASGEGRSCVFPISSSTGRSSPRFFRSF